jgi:deoxyribonuclease V
MRLCPIAIVDVHYEKGGARAACIVAHHWNDAAACEEQIAAVPAVQPYRPGAFFERELPCIVQVSSLIQTGFCAMVVDGYVDLDECGSPGLGAHLYEHFGGKFAVVGVAKTAYRGAAFAIKVLRGSSAKPLFVTAAGMPVADAARFVHNMHGKYRIPTLIRQVHRLARGAVALGCE